MTTYVGIDYGMGTSNVDKMTGIRYGVISQNSINLDWLSDFESEYGEPHCPSCGNEIKASEDDTLFSLDCMCDGDTHTEGCEDAGEPIHSEDSEWFSGRDYTCVDCQKCYWSDSVFPDDALSISYESDGYKITDCLDNDLFVLGSPYYTYAQFCSPCVPGAGNLDSPTEPETGAKCYALGHDWFDGGKAPYRMWTVADDLEVIVQD